MQRVTRKCLDKSIDQKSHQYEENPFSEDIVEVVAEDAFQSVDFVDSVRQAEAEDEHYCVEGDFGVAR